MKWLVAHCRPNSEKKAELNLKKQGFGVYFPKYKKIIKHARRLDTVIRPLFPRYIFVRFDDVLASWHSVRSTIGISYVLTAGDKPVTVPLWVLDQLRAREDQFGLISGSNELGFRKGDSIELLSRPFFRNQVVFNGLNDNQRVTVLLNLLGRKVTATVSESTLVLAN